MMKGIRAITTAAFISAATLTGCAKGEKRILHEVTNNPRITELANKLHDATFKRISKDASLECFYQDTFKVSEDDLENPCKCCNGLINSILTQAINNNAVLDIGVLAGDFGKYIQFRKYIDINAAVGKGVFTDAKGKDLFIPVEGYGTRNPMVYGNENQPKKLVNIIQ
jgi:hypothetical protein